MDSLADALTLSGGASRALRYYRDILTLLGDVEVMTNRQQAEALILYKMSRIHRKQNDIETETITLQKALRAVRATSINSKSDQKRNEELERRILEDLRLSSNDLQNLEMDWM